MEYDDPRYDSDICSTYSEHFGIKNYCRSSTHESDRLETWDLGSMALQGDIQIQHTFNAHSHCNQSVIHPSQSLMLQTLDADLLTSLRHIYDSLTPRSHSSPRSFSRKLIQNGIKNTSCLALSKSTLFALHVRAQSCDTIQKCERMVTCASGHGREVLLDIFLRDVKRFGTVPDLTGTVVELDRKIDLVLT
jgi:hypothetical protein